MKANIYKIIKKLSPILIGLIAITLIVDIFIANELGFGRNKVFIVFEVFLFALFLFFEFLKWNYKKKS